MCARVCVCMRVRMCVCVFICVCIVCASMRGSLKHSFIQKHTIQGEMSDELFRDISHRRKKVFFGG